MVGAHVACAPVYKPPKNITSTLTKTLLEVLMHSAHRCTVAKHACYAHRHTERPQLIEGPYSE